MELGFKLKSSLNGARSLAYNKDLKDAGGFDFQGYQALQLTSMGDEGTIGLLKNKPKESVIFVRICSPEDTEYPY